MFIDHRHEPIEQVINVVRTRARFRVSLETERRFVAPLEALQAAIEKRDVRHARAIWQTVRIDGKTVILAGDHHLPGIEVLYRVIGAMVAGLEFTRMTR